MSEQLKIENDAMIVEFSALGAEMKRIYSKALRKELLWNGDASVWSRSAPVLFPIVGKLIDNEYLYQGKSYSMSQHGFARDTSFSYESKSPSEIEFLMTATQKTFSSYPFCFDLRITYKVEGNSLRITHNVFNDDRQDILFSIGAHPGFLTLDISQYEINFENAETNYFRLKNGTVNWENAFSLNSKVLPLSAELFSQDALIFRNIKSSYVDLRNKNSLDIIRVRSTAPYWGIWGKGSAPFICIEPWFGIADVEGHNKNLANKEGIMTLPQGETFGFSYSIELVN